MHEIVRNRLSRRSPDVDYITVRNTLELQEPESAAASELPWLKADMAEITADVARLKANMRRISAEMSELQARVARLRRQFRYSLCTVIMIPLLVLLLL